MSYVPQFAGQLQKGRTLSSLDTTVLLSATPALLHLLTSCGLQGNQTQASLPVLRLKVLHIIDGVVDQAKAGGLATTELHTHQANDIITQYL